MGMRGYGFALAVALTALMFAVGCGYLEDAGSLASDLRPTVMPAILDTPMPAVSVPQAPHPTYAPLPTYAPYPTYTPDAATYSTAVARAVEDYASGTPLAVLPRLTATPAPTETPVPTATASPIPAEATAVAARVVSDNRQRCNAWAITNMQPIAYAEFRLLDPDAMSDNEKAHWRQIIKYGNYEVWRDSSDGEIPNSYSSELLICADYWSDPVSPVNAHKRNDHFNDVCYTGLYNRAVDWNKSTNRGWREESVDSSLPVINQHVRVMNWLDIGVDDLLQMNETPYELMGRLSRDGVVGVGNDGPWSLLTNYDEYDSEWYGLGHAWGYAQGDGCGAYYPQLFFNRWIPADVVSLDILDPRVSSYTPTPTATPFPAEFRGPDRSLFVPHLDEE